PQPLVDETIKRGIFVCPTINRNWETLYERVGRTYGRRLLEVMTSHHHAGVLYIAGSDAGIPGVLFSDYGAALMSYTKIGLTNAEVIQAATTRAAEALGMSSQIGKIAPGCRADLLVVSGNPLDSLAALRSVLLVVADGHLHWPPTTGAPDSLVD